MCLKSRILQAVHLGVKAKEMYDSCHISAYGAKAAFFMLLSAVPLTAFVLTVGAMALSLDIPFAVDLIGELLNMADTTAVKEMVAQFTEQLWGNKGFLAAGASFGLLLWSAIKGVRSIANGINVIYGGQKRGLVDMAVRSVVYMLFMTAALALSFVVLVMASPLENLITAILGAKGGILIGVINLRNIIFFLLLWMLFSFAYRFLGSREIAFSKHLWGGALTSVGWIAVSFGYSLYIKHFYRYPVVYGSFGAVVLFMMWLYICMNILLCGALINRIIWQKGKNCD